ncbi:MAG: threonine synthase [Alistipes sp.]|nr:threonine synthase [Alistipes sp.]
MKYYSTNQTAPQAGLRQAVTEGLAPDKGLYMPERIRRLPDEFFERIDRLGFHEIAKTVASAFFGDDIPQAELDRIVDATLCFDTPVVHVGGEIWSLELFHGPTAAFKDVGARFMARMLGHFTHGEAGRITVLVATSGDTGSAVANGFLGVEGIDVVVLYPKGKVSDLQEKQFTTLGQNITAIEIDGTFDDCQRLVKHAFMDSDLKTRLTLTSANSINVARFLPQSFYYFHAYAQMKRAGKGDGLVFAVPSGNFGNLTAGLFAMRMGLPVRRFIAANNRNDVFLEYLRTGVYTPRPSVETVANAMDVGDPSNFARILDLYANDVEAIRRDISAFRYDDGQITQCIGRVHSSTGYTLDPHGACGYLALEEGLHDGEHGVLLETAHPAKFGHTVEAAIGGEVPLPRSLEGFVGKQKQSVPLGPDYDGFRKWLTGRG